MTLNHSEQMMQGIEVRDAMGKDILVKAHLVTMPSIRWWAG